MEIGPGISETWRFADTWPLDLEVPRAATGVVPVETPVLHNPTEAVGAVTPDVRLLAKHMIKVMRRAPGVGLAANQVGAPLRLFVQLHKRVLPEVVIDPEIRASEGQWTYPEGCLSLRTEGVDAPVVRPKWIQVRGRTLHGDVFEATLDEVVARICQHEIDHLDGIEYVQRLTGDHERRVYRSLADAGIDTAWLPLEPY